MSVAIARRALLVLLLLAGCGGGRRSNPGTSGERLAEVACEELFRLGSERLDAGNETEARQYLRRYEQRCPREPNIEQAKLKICDSYLAESAIDLRVEGLAACRQIITFYPNHPVACAAQLRIANYHFAEMRSCDRDQSETQSAVDEYQRLLTNYPNCELRAEAEEKLSLAKDRLACAELMVADFYRKVDRPKAVASRLGDLLEKYPDYSRRCRAYRYHIEALLELDQTDEARRQLARMAEVCSNDEDMAKARAQLQVAPSVESEAGR